MANIDAERYLYDSSQFDGTVTIYFEAPLSPPPLRRHRLRDLARPYRRGDVGSALTSTNTDLTLFARVRSGAGHCSPTGQDYTVRLKNAYLVVTDLSRRSSHLVIQQHAAAGLTKTESTQQMTYEDAGNYNNTSYTAKLRYHALRTPELVGLQYLVLP